MKLTPSNLYCVMLVIAGLSASCKKTTDADIQEQGTEKLTGIGPVPPYKWTELDIPGQRINYPFNAPWSRDYLAPAGDTYFLWTGNQQQGGRVFRLNKTRMQWEAHPGWKIDDNWVIERKLLFKYQSKVYCAFDYPLDPAFAVLDPIAGTVTNLAPFPDPDSIGYYPNSFVLGDNGYLFFNMGHGYWRYNFPTDTWTRIGENPFFRHRDLTIVTANGKVYAGMGYTIEDNGGSTYSHYHRDWVEFNPENPAASITKADFPFLVTGDTRTCVSGDNIYVGFGDRHGYGSSSESKFHLYKYNVSTNRWSQVSDYPGTQVSLSPLGSYLETNVNMFAIGSSVYVVAGGIWEFWRYSNSQLVVGTN
jgi:hypothetical protein